MNEYPNLSDSISVVIEMVRRERGISKSALADFSSLDRRYLREIEVGSKKPTVNAIFSICDALEISPVDFFSKVCERLNQQSKK